MFRFTRVAAVTVGAAALLLASCGSDKSDVPEATTLPSTTAAATTTVAATTTTVTTVVLIKAGDACGVYGTSQKAGGVVLYCNGEVWGIDVPPSTTAAPTG